MRTLVLLALITSCASNITKEEATFNYEVDSWDKERVLINAKSLMTSQYEKVVHEGSDRLILRISDVCKPSGVMVEMSVLYDVNLEGSNMRFSPIGTTFIGIRDGGNRQLSNKMVCNKEELKASTQRIKQALFR